MQPLGSVPAFYGTRMFITEFTRTLPKINSVRNRNHVLTATALVVLDNIFDGTDSSVIG
jgi:hypothetical protein